MEVSCSVSRRAEILEPLGKQPPLGYGNVSFVEFTPKDVGDMFDIDMDSIKTCKREKQGKCPGDPPPPGPGRRAQEDFTDGEIVVVVVVVFIIIIYMYMYLKLI